MSAIAYITDSKLLELHRLNANKKMNFWRVSTKVSFSDFGVEDLVFFLSKDKEHSRGGEKGIVGYGKLKAIYINSPSAMWKKFGSSNGYNSYDEFKEAIVKVTKDHKLPNKISSFFLDNVVFFQAPIYLSECEVEISKNVESYIYINPEETVIKLLDYAKDAVDIWSSSDGLNDDIIDQQIEYAAKLAYKKIGDYIFDEKKLAHAYNMMKKYVNENPMMKFIGDSKINVGYVKEKDVLIVMYYGKDVDYRTLIGQAELYKENIKKYYNNAYNIYFKTSNNNKEIDNLLNRY